MMLLIAIAVMGMTTHQRSMREMIEELDARSARLAAAHLSDGLTERAVWLKMTAANKVLPANDGLDTFFDGGLARFDAGVVEMVGNGRHPFVQFGIGPALHAKKQRRGGGGSGNSSG